MSQAAGFGAVLILTAYLEYDADLKMFRQVWNWAVPLQSPLFTFKVNLLEVADLILQAGLDPTEMALLCALCLLRTGNLFPWTLAALPSNLLPVLIIA